MRSITLFYCNIEARFRQSLQLSYPRAYNLGMYCTYVPFITVPLDLLCRIYLPSYACFQPSLTARTSIVSTVCHSRAVASMFWRCVRHSARTLSASPFIVLVISSLFKLQRAILHDLMGGLFRWSIQSEDHHKQGLGGQSIVPACEGWGTFYFFYRCQCEATTLQLVLTGNFLIDIYRERPRDICMDGVIQYNHKRASLDEPIRVV